MKVLVTGSCGLVGSAVVNYYVDTVGIDNDSRGRYFGKDGSIAKTRSQVLEVEGYRHNNVDIRDRAAVEDIFRKEEPEAVVHAAAQPAHEYSKAHPVEDFDINVGGTVNILNAARQHCPEAPFIFLSSSKVYGSSVNRIPLFENDLRYDYFDRVGIDESLPLDGSYHSPYGAHKVAADVIAQEYFYEYGMPTMVLRPNCMTGTSQAGVEMHGFLTYLVRCAMNGTPYHAFGYKGKQVRCNIHSRDVARAIAECIADPEPGGVFNLGGGRGNDVSILEMADRMKERDLRLKLEVWDEARGADHIVYITDNTSFKLRYPNWEITMPLDAIIDEIVYEFREVLV